MYKIITRNRGMVKNNKDKIELLYTVNNELLSRTKVLESCEYEYWYEYETTNKNTIEILSLNITIDNTTYKNIDRITINNNRIIPGVFEGTCHIERRN